MRFRYICDMEPNDTTARIVSTIPKVLGLKTYELAEQLGMGKVQLYEYTSGKYPPKWEFWNKLLTRFPQLSADYLLTGKGNPLRD